MHHRPLAILLAVVVLTSCGRSGAVATPTTVAAGSAEFPVTVAVGNGDVTIVERPERIVSLSATATETLFAIGAGPQVVAVDEFSNYPSSAPITELSGFDSNIEALAAYEPDLVIAFFDPGELVSGLEAVGIPVIVQYAPVTLDEAYGQILQLGAATGNSEAADVLVQGIQDEIESVVSSLPAFDESPSYYHELDATLYTVTSSTFLGALYELVGLENIADPADSDGFGYPQLSAEFIVEADPDLIFLADTMCCAESAETVAARPGWGAMSAVVNDRIVELDDDVASRWGPRIVDLVRAFAGALTSLGSGS